MHTIREAAAEFRMIRGLAHTQSISWSFNWQNTGGADHLKGVITEGRSLDGTQGDVLTGSLRPLERSSRISTEEYVSSRKG